MVSPLTVGCCAIGQMRNFVRIKRRCEAGEHSGTQGSDDLVRSALTSQNDALYSGPNGAHLLQQRQVFIDGAVRTRDYDPERSHAQSLQGFGMSGRILDGQISGT